MTGRHNVTADTSEPLDEVRQRVAQAEGIPDLWGTLMGRTEAELAEAAKDRAGDVAHTAAIGESLRVRNEAKAGGLAELLGLTEPEPEPSPLDRLDTAAEQLAEATKGPVA